MYSITTSQPIGYVKRKSGCATYLCGFSTATTYLSVVVPDLFNVHVGINKLLNIDFLTY